MKYDLLKEVQEFIADFDNPKKNNAKGKGRSKYIYSQKDLIERIDLATKSQFETGHYDSDGQRKIFLNIVNFFVDVAYKSTDIDTRNFVFVPEGLDNGNRWSTWLFSRQFKYFVKDTGLAKIINEVGYNFNKYGSVVLKKCVEEGETELEIVPLQSIRNPQEAESLEDGIEAGGMVTIEHEYSYNQLKEYKDYTLPARYKGKKEVQEVYTLVPKSAIEGDGKSDKDEDYVLVMAVVIPDLQHILFIEEIEELPFLEVHDRKLPNRWLAVGEAEKQLENQIAHNLAVNLHRRGMMWSSKKIFKKKGEVDVKSLTSEVEDGDMIAIDINGDIAQIDTTSKSTGEYNNFLQVFGDNSQKNAFAFESQTGEQMQSGTPFRLGAMLSNASQGYFDMKKEKLGLFWKDVFWDLILPEFKKTAKRDIEMISQTDDGYSAIKELFVEVNTRQYFKDYFLSEDAFKYKQPAEDEIKQKVEEELIKSPYLVISEITKDLYKNAKFTMELDITGESIEPADKETLVTLYTTLAQKGDPRADKILEQIMSLMGKNLQAIAGKATSQTTPANNQTATNPNLQGLVPQQ